MERKTSKVLRVRLNKGLSSVSPSLVRCCGYDEVSCSKIAAGTPYVYTCANVHANMHNTQAPSCAHIQACITACKRAHRRHACSRIRPPLDTWSSIRVLAWPCYTVRERAVCTTLVRAPRTFAPGRVDARHACMRSIGRHACMRVKVWERCAHYKHPPRGRSARRRTF